MRVISRRFISFHIVFFVFFSLFLFFCFKVSRLLSMVNIVDIVCVLKEKNIVFVLLFYLYTNCERELGTLAMTDKSLI